ncbi:MAG TPA: GMC family oxidoreductase [Myxococcota bacterium]|jgi:choline dehydrogenase-like flavoprotein|nr:GMC family oxidoreductase [Myxococcota bacterium]
MDAVAEAEAAAPLDAALAGAAPAYDPRWGGRFRPVRVTDGRSLQGDLDLDADVCVVGSGAAGAVVARLLSEAGADVVVLEEGSYVRADRYARFRPSETLRHLWRDGGMTTVIPLGDTPPIGLALGRCVGGSSVLTGGVCFRVPEDVHHEWVHDFGLAEMAYERFVPAYEEVERNVRVESVPPEMRARGVHLFAEGAARLGHPLRPVRRNTEGCCGCARCNVGCPNLAKLSVDLTYLPQAADARARIYADCLVQRVTVDGDRATGVIGRVLDERRRPRGRLRVRARLVVLAAGTIHTPLVLSRSGLGRWSGQVGRNVTLHPGFRVMGLFDEKVEPWKGALQSAYTDAFHHEGIMLIAAFGPPTIVAPGLPGVAEELHEHLARLPYLACFGGMVHDGPGGRVRRFVGREPLITYRFSPRDRARFRRGIRLLAETFFAAGARAVYLPLLGARPVKSVEELRIVDEFPARRIECMAFHPLGSARMARRAEDGVVNEWGEAFEVRNLVVADGSVFPSSLGVNSQIAIMSNATRITHRLREERGRWKS